MLSEKEKLVISLIQDDLPLDRRPFKVLAEKAQISEDELIGMIEALKKGGVIRRFGATLRHQNAGFKFNAMVVWNVDESDVERVGRLFASLKEVTHCYYRVRTHIWSYTLYTMIHGATREACLQIASKMAGLSQIQDYQVLFSRREFKKTSMLYF